MLSSIKSNLSEKVKGKRSPRRGRAGNGPRAFRPECEPLETRLVPSFVPLSSPIDVAGSSAAGQFLSTPAPTAFQAGRTAAESANGDYRVVWESSTGIYTRLFSASGVPLGNPFHVYNTDGSDTQATVAMNASGASVIVWIRDNNGLDFVMTQHFGPDGAPVGVPSGFNNGASNGHNPSQPSVAMNADKFIIAYTDTYGNSTQVQAYLFDPAARTSTPVTVTSSTATSQPSVALNAAGKFVIAYTEDAGDSNLDVYAQRFGAGGTRNGAALPVATTSHIENEPSAAIDARGDFVVAYTYVRSSQLVDASPFPDYLNNQSEVHAVLYSARGGVLRTDTVWASPNIDENGYDPSAAMDGAGNLVVAYTKGGNYGPFYSNDGGPTVWAAAYDKTGALVQGGLSLSSGYTTLGNPPGGPAFTYDSRPSVALCPTGHLVADWQNFGTQYTGDLTGTAVYTQAFASAPFQYQLLDGHIINILGGMPATFRIAITRDAGFSGPITIGFSSLPPGVTAAVSPDSPAPTEVRTVTFNSPNGLAYASLASTLIIAGGGTSLLPAVQFNTTPSVITGWASSAGPTLTKGFWAVITGSGFVPGSTVQFGSPSATATPTSIDPSGKSLTVSVPMNAVNGPITIVRPGGKPIVSGTGAQYTEGAVTGLSTNTGFAQGYSTPYLSALQENGSSLAVYGYGFQPGAVVLFGDPGSGTTGDLQKLKQYAAQYGTTPSFLDPGGASLTVNVPRDAVSGHVWVVEPDGTGLQSPQQLTVNDYRNTFGFSFPNFNFNINFGMIKAEYGGDQVDYTLFGQDTGVPTLEALAVWGIAAAALNGKGACFGMALTSVLLSEYTPTLINSTNGLPNGAAAAVYNLQRNGPLTAMIEQNHLAQISAEVISYFKKWQIMNAVGAIQAPFIYGLISAELAAGQHPIISMQAGADHAVVAYDLEPGPKANGDFYIDVYDPNRPFGETTQDACAGVEQASRIYIDPSSGWSFQMQDGSNHSGGYGTLEVIPVNLVAGGVTFPTTLDGLLTIILGSGPPSGARVAAAPVPVTSAVRGAAAAPPTSLHADCALPSAYGRWASLAQWLLSKPARRTGLTTSDLTGLDDEGWIDLPAAL
jgi:hypothetical protein